MAASNHRKRGVRAPRAEYIVNVVVFTGYAAVAAVASALKAWQTAGDLEAVGWLPKTNAIVWDTITLYAALGALALGVREMVLAYFMRKGYEEDFEMLLRSQEAQVEIVKTLTESMQQEREERKQERAEREREREWEERQLEREQYQQERAERERQYVVIEQLLEQNRQLMERLDRRDNGRRAGHSDRADQPDNPGYADRADHPDHPGSADRADQPDQPGYPDRADRPDSPDNPQSPNEAQE